jgi:hypothetical protein
VPGWLGLALLAVAMPCRRASDAVRVDIDGMDAGS